MGERPRRRLWAGAAEATFLVVAGLLAVPVTAAFLAWGFLVVGQLLYELAHGD
jgi:hypothetical protein